jgi:hypothetical protein
MAIIVGMAIGFTDLSDDNMAGTLVHEFGELLEGVEAEILAIPDNTEPTINTSDTLQTEDILSQIAYIEAFDEVIRKQIL